MLKKELLAVYASEKNNLNFLSPDIEAYRKIENYNYSKPPHEGILFYRRFAIFSWHPRVDSDNPSKICDLIVKSDLYLNYDS